MYWAGFAAASVLVVAVAACSDTVVTRAPTPPPLPSATAVNKAPVSVPTVPPIGPGPIGAITINNLPFEVLHKKALDNIATKLTALNTASGALTNIAHLGASGKAVERDEITTTIQGLTGLETEIAEETNIGLLRTEALHLVDYADVGAVIVPKVDLLQSADTVLGNADGLAREISSLQARLNAAAAQGKSVGSAGAALNTIQGGTLQAAAAANGIMEAVPAITPGEVNQITADNATLAQARNDLSAAQSAVGAVANALQATGA
jgi:hypothetical protein